MVARAAFAVGLIGTLGAGLAWAGPLEDGLAAYSRGDYASAMTLLRPLADQANPRAQNQLGVMYQLGNGVAENQQEAFRWYHLAAEQGLPEAAFNTGGLYYRGQGVLQDYLHAHMWINLAASLLTGDGARGAIQIRDEIATKMTPAQIADAQAAGRACRAADFKNCDR